MPADSEPRPLQANLTPLLLIGLALALPLAFATGSVPTSPEGNPSCADLGGWAEIKVDPPRDGTYTSGNRSVTVDVDEAVKTFTWSSDFSVAAVFVKDGVAGNNLYEYPGGATSGSGTTPGNGTISHISFCYEPDASPPSTTTSTSPPPTSSTSTSPLPTSSTSTSPPPTSSSTSTSPPPTSSTTSSSPPPTSSTTSSTSPPPQCPEGMDRLATVSYTVDGAPADDLTGNVHSGDTVTATFTLAEGCQDVRLSLASYEAPSATFGRDTADQQVLHDQDTGLFGAAGGSLTVEVPGCFFQLDFVFGAVLEHLGPADSGNFYSDQGRLIDSASGGSESCQPTSSSTSTSPPPTSTTTSTSPPTGSSTTTTTGPPSPPSPTPTTSPPSGSPPGPCPVDMTSLSGVTYTVEGKAVPTLADHVGPFERVQVAFTVDEGCQAIPLVLAAYTAPDATLDAADGDDLRLYNLDAGDFGPGAHELQVRVPACFFHVAFAFGEALPDYAGGSYASEGRLISADTGGQSACASGDVPTNGLACPSDLFTVAHNDGSILLTFTPANGSVGTQVFRDDGDGWMLLTVLDAGAAEYLDTSAEPGHVYAYRTDAMHPTGVSVGCPQTEVTAIPDFPTTLALGLGVAGAVLPLAWRMRRK